jgi:excisionase family DNA binding protein
MNTGAASIGGMPNTEPLMTASEVAEILGVEESWVRSQSRAGQIPTVILGRWRRYRPEAIRDWVKEQEK